MPGKFILPLAMLVAAAPALAQPATTDSIRVHVGDVDMSKPNAMRVINARLDNAIADLCGLHITGDREEAAAIAACRADAAASVADWRQQMAQRHAAVTVASRD